MTDQELQVSDDSLMSDAALGSWNLFIDLFPCSPLIQAHKERVTALRHTVIERVDKLSQATMTMMDRSVELSQLNDQLR
jgi:hypothetical protein